MRRYEYSLRAVEREDHGSKGEGRTEVEVVPGEKRSTKSLEEGRAWGGGGEMMKRPLFGEGGGGEVHRVLGGGHREVKERKRRKIQSL